ncbi:unnamed protein product [Triticum turgidum subsp. durum]|uniref:Cyclic phosphodiesterase n=1 Tax=Triticum turgidum subsp. durum TaxID=4567 RepID=A0A9R1BWV2_TRITD|nr:unnamed protein product [Triticum turgidum subsp. durum]
MDPTDQSPEEMYSVWALLPEPVRRRLLGLMAGLRAAHGGAVFEPHATVLGAMRLRRSAAIEALRAAAAGLGPYTARVASIGRYGVNLLLEPTREVMATSDHCRAHFGYQRPTPYVPHLSLLYGDHLTEEEMAAARKKAGEMDKGIFGLQFEISELALYKTDPKDKSLESWELVELCHLQKK